MATLASSLSARHLHVGGCANGASGATGVPPTEPSGLGLGGSFFCGRKLPAMEPLDFDSYVDVLRQRLFDHEALHNDGTLPHFDDLMDDYRETAPAGWPEQAYDELMAQGHLDPRASGQVMGPHSFGRLSADGRLCVRQQRQDD